MRRLLYRNVRARDNLEAFLVAAVSSLLLLRFYLYLAHYPQVGGGSLHIAHMLYGGLLMMVAIVLLVSYLGARVQRVASIIGGVGFGIFIDELGKFITKDNNYFFRPTIGVIYAIFIALYLAFNFVSRRGNLTDREYQLNALNQFEEVVEHDLDRLEKDRLRQLLRRADRHDALTKGLQKILADVETVPPAQPNRLAKSIDHLTDAYDRFWARRGSNHVVGAVFLVEAIIFLVAVLATVIHNLDAIQTLFQGSDSYSSELIIGQLISSVIAGIFALLGAVKLASSRLEAFEQFRRAILVTLFLTEFFIFSRIQFGALPSFIINLLLLLALRYSLHQEYRSQVHQP